MGRVSSFCGFGFLGSRRFFAVLLFLFRFGSFFALLSEIEDFLGGKGAELAFFGASGEPSLDYFFAAFDTDFALIVLQRHVAEAFCVHLRNSGLVAVVIRRSEPFPRDSAFCNGGEIAFGGFYFGLDFLVEFIKEICSPKVTDGFILGKPEGTITFATEEFSVFRSLKGDVEAFAGSHHHTSEVKDGEGPAAAFDFGS